MAPLKAEHGPTTPPLEALLIALFASAVLFFAALWLTTEWRTWWRVPLQQQLDQGSAPSLESLQRLYVESHGVEQSWLSGSHLHYPGLVGQLLLEGHPLPLAERIEIGERSEKATRSALAREPANAQAWARLAWLRHLGYYPVSEILDPLRLSMQMAPAQRGLLLWRLELAAIYQSAWDEEFERLLERQVVYAWRASPRGLVTLATKHNITGFIYGILSAQHEDGDMFLQMIAARRIRS